MRAFYKSLVRLRNDRGDLIFFSLDMTIDCDSDCGVCKGLILSKESVSIFRTAHQSPKEYVHPPVRRAVRVWLEGHG
jgi:hypothetical protein